MPPGTCPELAHCACRQGTGRSPHFAGLFGAVGPRLQDWVEALRAMAGGSFPAPTPDEEQLPRETWLFLQVFGEGWAQGRPYSSGDSATRDQNPPVPPYPFVTSLEPIIHCTVQHLLLCHHRGGISPSSAETSALSTTNEEPAMAVIPQLRI